MTDRDEYVRVNCRVMHIRDGAALLAVGDGVSRGAWIPRSLIHGVDDKVLTSKAHEVNGSRGWGNIRMVIRVFRWKAQEVGFITDRDSDTKELFDQE